jgi:small multidrug resistance pump
MKVTLRLAALYNVLWGAWVVLFPQQFFEVTGMDPINHPVVWQGMGMVIGVYGLGYYWASYDALRHWPIVMVGFLGKIFGPLGFVINWLAGDIPGSFGYMLITNDLIWWIPFYLILKRVRKEKGWKLSE